MEEKKKVKTISTTKMNNEVKEEVKSEKYNTNYDTSISDMEIIKAYEGRGRNKLKVLAGFLLGIIAAIALFSSLGLSSKSATTTSTKTVTKDPAYIGIYMVNLEDADALSYYELDDVETTLKRGVVVETVVPGSAAYGKLKRGDIIIEFNGEDIENMSDLLIELDKHYSGNKAKFVIERNGRTRDITFTLGTKR